MGWEEERCGRGGCPRPPDGHLGLCREVHRLSPPTVGGSAPGAQDGRLEPAPPHSPLQTRDPGSSGRGGTVTSLSSSLLLSWF